MADPRRHLTSQSVPDAFLADLLSRQLTRWRADRGLTDFTVVDLGGGTGTLAITLAMTSDGACPTVTVIDPNLDALASLHRRIDEQRLSDRVRGIQGDAAELTDLVPAASVDVLVCHRTLEVVDDPATALAAMATVVRPGGVLSLVVPQRRAAVLSQALAGHVGAAIAAIDDPSRFDLDQVSELVGASGFTVQEIDGIGALAGHVPPAALEHETGPADQLYELESRLSRDAAFRAIAPWAHLFAMR